MKLPQYYEARRVETEYGRHYIAPDSRIFPGVTTILDKTKPEAAKTALELWRERENRRSPGSADRQTAAACNRGTWVHNSIEYRMDTGLLPEYHYAYQPWLNSVLPLLPHIGEKLMSEKAVFHTQYGYAGTFDLLVRADDGRILLVDWKTSARPKTPERLHDYSLQLAAYTRAIEYTYQEEEIYIDGAKLVIALPDQKPQIVFYTREELDDLFGEFEKRLNQYKEWRLQTRETYEPKQ